MPTAVPTPDCQTSWKGHEQLPVTSFQHIKNFRRIGKRGAGSRKKFRRSGIDKREQTIAHVHHAAHMQAQTRHPRKKSRISCKAELWRTQHFGKESKQVPITTFNTQKFESWLEWFLSRKSTEDYLSQSYQRPAAADGEEMSDLQDSPRWKELKALGDKYNLVFGLYIDWFNPRSNKLAGVKVTGRIVPLVADLPAAREAGGFLSYAATMFCCFCLLTKDEKARLDYWAWPKRIAATVHKQAKAWFKQPTKEKRVNMALQATHNLGLLGYMFAVRY
ncbi:hypothetical protein C8R45DRAFT_938628 [Mycena sanguinolenta]|nr:hypothetical protein C8R45DRAFT_938628 [Mycena sanguinolenta]